jgi:transglutaminase-like putative cysteine protease
MRIRVQHEIRFRFEVPVKSLVRLLRLTPRNHEGQHVASWRIDVETDCRLPVSEDAFGNLVHVLNGDGQVEVCSLDVSGEVETFDTGGVLRGTLERFPPELYLRDTPLTAADPALRRFADAAVSEAEGPLAELHALLETMDRDFERLPGTAPPQASTGKTLEHKRGTAVDLAHVFVAAARHRSIPARFVSGYVPEASTEFGEAGIDVRVMTPPHAWAEAHVPLLGWVGFDPSKGICPQDAHVRLAIGLDRLDAAPVRAARQGVGHEFLETRLQVTAAKDRARP